MTSTANHVDLRSCTLASRTVSCLFSASFGETRGAWNLRCSGCCPRPVSRRWRGNHRCFPAVGGPLLVSSPAGGWSEGVMNLLVVWCSACEWILWLFGVKLVGASSCWFPGVYQFEGQLFSFVPGSGVWWCQPTWQIFASLPPKARIHVKKIQRRMTTARWSINGY